jgi:translation elongation factor P/translation initiation factor 5A
MKTPLTLASTLVLSLTLSAAANAGEAAPAKAPASAVKTEEKAAMNAKGDAATVMTISTVTATVDAIDLKERTFTLTGAKGKSVVVEAGPEVRNLEQLKVGDKVVVEYYEGVAAELKAPDASRKEVKLTDAVVRAAPGERPGGGVGTALTATVQIEYVDRFRNVVQFTGPRGKTRTVTVQKPEFRKMLKNLKVGDKVELTFFEALAISVKPAKK